MTIQFIEGRPIGRRRFYNDSLPVPRNDAAPKDYAIVFAIDRRPRVSRSVHATMNTIAARFHKGTAALGPITRIFILRHVSFPPTASVFALTGWHTQKAGALRSRELRHVR